ncbi:uncharacterized protein [Linepithema humile]|uniref:uncharacterized protein isoform X2 n=1 Tax=Linepithema humile TaxID=83485 RepID=UPI00351E8019
MDERKPFLQLSERQQRRRLAAVVVHVNNAASVSEVDVTNNDINVESRSVENELIAESENESIGETCTSCSSQERMDEIEDNIDIDDNINMDVDEEDVIGNEECLAAKLCDWALLFGISHVALSALLIILRIYLPMEQLPKDARTLLCTPRKTVIRKVARLCWWPPKTVNLSKAIAKGIAHEDHWDIHPFHKLWGPYETYTIAKQAEKDSVEWSTGDENVITTPKPLGKRIITKSCKVLSNESNDEESSSSDKQKRYKQKLNTLPPSGYINDTNKKKRFKQLDSNSKSSVKDNSNESVTTEEYTADTDTDDQKEKELFEETLYDGNTSFKDRRPVQVQASLSKNKVSFNNLPQKIIQKEIAKCSCCEYCRQEHRERFLKLEKKINYLIEVARSESKTRNLSQRQTEIDAMPDFYLESKNAVDAFESQLISCNAVCEQFKHFIIRIGGTTATKHVNNILSAIFSDELARDYSWTGRKNTFAFQGMRMAKILIGI